MTERQKSAIRILLNLRVNDYINEDDFFALMEFVFAERRDGLYIPPFPATEPAPNIYPWITYKTSCSANEK